MTMKRYINLLLAFCVSALTLQSCFQDMDHPAFDYPDSSAPKVFSPMKLFLPFENDMRDKGNYTFLMSAGGDITYTDGINGQAYQGTKDTYLLARVPSYLTDSIPDLGSCTVAFWMKTTRNTSAYGVFSIPNTKTFWGNFDNDERWVEAKIDNVFGTEWVHMAFVYDGSNSTVTVYRNGESAFTKELPGYGKLKFKDLGTFAIGAFQFSTKPSLTEGAGAQSWASNFPGQLDQFRFYDRAISASDIKQLYSGKE